ncbi:MAG: TonB-dependent receptor plug domain-containing protein, partial [Opitutaceae bacterium]
MKTKSPPLRIAFSSSALLIVNLAYGQAVAPVPPVAPKTTDSIIELSPFVTSVDSDKGYAATSSLAGSRVNTPLKDIAAQIDVLTPEFINDIGATTIDEAVVFSTNNGGPNDQNTGPNAGITTTRANGRARGFDAISNSTDFYATNLPSDLYNIERITIANGPQSILFGLGNAGGVIDTSTKRALFRESNELGLRVDNNGSFRGTLDLNRVLVPKKLAVRFAAVRNENKSYVEDAFNRQARLFGALTWKLTPTTTLRLSGERIGQRASNASNFLAQDYVSPWVAAGRPLYDNSTGNAAITATAFPLLNRNSNALRVFSYGGPTNSVLVWNGSGLTRGPHQLAGAVDTRDAGLTDNAIYPTDRDVRVGGRMNVLHGKVLRGAVEQKITDTLFVELGFNYEAVAELLGGSFDNAESINIFADPNRFLPGGTTAARQTALNPYAGQLYVESFPSGSEVRNVTKELRLTTSYEFDFKKHFGNVARHFGRHRLAALASIRIDEDRSQASRAMILGNPSFATGDLLNNSRFLRSRYYLDPASGSYTARALPGGGGDARLFGPWTFTDSARNETFQATMFDHPDGRSSATGGSRKDITTGMLALQSFFLNDRLNLFAGRRVDQFKSYLIAPSALVRGDRLTPGDRQGLYVPLSRAAFDTSPALDDSGTTFSYGAVVHATRWLSLFGSRSNNAGLPPGFLDPDNRQIPGIFSRGHDFGFNLALREDAISLRVNFYEEEQHALIGDAQDVRTAAAVIEERLRGTDRPAGIGTVAADGYDPVTRGNVYRSVEDKVAKGIDVTLVARITSNWDVRVAGGQQRTRVFNKGLDFSAWTARRLPVWQQFGGLGWDNVAISTSDPRTVHQYYDQQIAAEILRQQLRNNLPRFRQREWRASLFTNYRVREGVLKGLNFGGGVRWLDHTMIGLQQRAFPGGATGDDVTKPIFGPAQFAVDLLLGYSGRTKVIAGHKIGWRVQLNVRNLLDDDELEPIRANLGGG